MPRRILVIVGQPAPNPGRLCRTLAAAYTDGAERAGHDVRRIDVATLGFPMLRTQQEFEHGDIPKSLEEASQHIVWAEHLVFVFPLWLGTMPALLKAFHAARYGFRISGGRRLHQNAAGRTFRTRRRDYGHAGLRLPPLVSRPRHRRDAPQHPQLRGRKAGARNALRACRGRQGSAGQLDR